MMPARKESTSSSKEADRTSHTPHINKLAEESLSDSDLLTFWKQMHMSGGINGTKEIQHSNTQADPAGALIISRKRKAWEVGPIGGNKYVGSGRLPVTQGSDDEEGTGLETPNCSRTGFDDEGGEQVGGGGGEKVGVGGDQTGSAGDQTGTDGEPLTYKNLTAHKSSILSPMNPNLLNVEDIDADNLAADFDGSFTGLGVDITTANYSMSEAMLSINNIALASHLKQEGNRLTIMKPETQYLFSNYGALDLSNDEAQYPDSNEGEVNVLEPPTFSGSVSRDNDQEGLRSKTAQLRKSSDSTVPTTKTKLEKNSPVHQLIVQSGDCERLQNVNQVSDEAGFTSPKLEYTSSLKPADEDLDASFQYILTAPTSIATKKGEPSLTYINQGQSYELKLKKLGDLSNHYKKKWLRSSIRICFHERRLQYIESEQIAEWSRTHPNERILEVDLPLSYGIAEVQQDPSNLSTVTFSWDPTRETGVFIKVHCISTEFTPKKHGGEKGVPFRLQVETWSSEARIHAAACILQVFKLKGADRKHKQDREKVQKRTVTEQEKFSQQFECTVLTELSVDSIYIPPSRGISPVQSDGEGSVVSLPPASKPTVKASSLPPSARDESHFQPPPGVLATKSRGLTPPDSKSWKVVLAQNANAEATAGWLAFNRFGQYVKTFQNYDCRDLLRLSKSELVQMIGLVDGVRLFNDLHMKPVAPKLVIYLAQEGENVFHPVLLEEVTVLELSQQISNTFQIPTGLTKKVIITGPGQILVRMTDEYLRYQTFDSAYTVHVIYAETRDSCTIHLEPVASHL